MFDIMVDACILLILVPVGFISYLIVTAQQQPQPQQQSNHNFSWVETK